MSGLCEYNKRSFAVRVPLSICVHLFYPYGKQSLDSKEQKFTWQKVPNELKEMAKLDKSILLLEKIIADPTEDQTRIWIKSVGWKMINVNKGIAKFEKLIASWEQLKTKVIDELVSTNTGGAAVSDLQHVDFQFLLDSFSV